MTQEDKLLLIKDLCARLPYLTKCYCEWSKEASNGTSGCIDELSTFLIDELEIMGKPEYDCQISGIKPYLRPMSSMTEEEKKDYKKTFETYENIMGVKLTYTSYSSYDWLNAHHFDFRGLIEKELALEAPEGMYNV